MKFEKGKVHIIKGIAFKFIVRIKNLKYYIWVLGTNLKLSTNKIAWIHWSLNLGPASKVTLITY
jgi:hypothetical protein